MESWFQRLVAERAQVWCQGCGANICVKRFVPIWPTWDSVRLRTASTLWDVPGKCGPYGELFFFLTKEQVVASYEVLSIPCVSAETLEACAPIGFHLLAADCEMGSSGGQSLD